jgi:hypothetical protein
MIDYVIRSETGAKAMSILRFLSGRGRLPCAFALLVLLFSAPLAHASTFNFSFTTTDLLGALKGSDTDFQSDGYYAIFLQPTVMPTGDSLVASETAGPDPTDGGAAWISTTLSGSTDTSLPGIWVQFSKGNNQTTITVVSGANDAGGNGTASTNIFYHPGLSPLNTYTDSGMPYAPPIGFSGAKATISALMAANAVFSFQLTGTASPGASILFNGDAEAIWSQGSSATYSSPKTREDIPFTMNFTNAGSNNYQATPEPGTWILLIAGAACVIAAGILKNKRRAASNDT